jgi:hypothetical protein
MAIATIPVVRSLTGAAILVAGLVVLLETAESASARAGGARGVIGRPAGRPAVHRTHFKAVHKPNFQAVSRTKVQPRHVRFRTARTPVHVVSPRIKPVPVSKRVPGLGSGPAVAGAGLKPGPGFKSGFKLTLGHNLRRPNLTMIHNRPVSIFRGSRRIWWRGGDKTLAALGLLGGIDVGGSDFYPDGYVVMAEPACQGRTPDGCSLTWQNVPTEDGGAIAQCVQYCPRRVIERPTPAITPAMRAPVAPQAAAVAAAQNCQLMIFS